MSGVVLMSLHIRDLQAKQTFAASVIKDHAVNDNIGWLHLKKNPAGSGCRASL